ncbi:hypothetical protein XELAEV_18001115mg [Xenopus laevis]|uniref:Uncharacterized protein n=1 Tax=Xenopus laevis TaxID=8355 RepID=A0A974GZ41_XENLA|nr:hypothetical protein XELAEV_18001115mg [Xenopus laevis]
MLNIPNLFPILKVLKPHCTLFTLALTPNPIPSFGTKVPESSPFPITLQNHSNHQSSQPCLFPTLNSNTNPNMYTLVREQRTQSLSLTFPVFISQHNCQVFTFPHTCTATPLQKISNPQSSEPFLISKS